MPGPCRALLKGGGTSVSSSATSLTLHTCSCMLSRGLTVDAWENAASALQEARACSRYNKQELKDVSLIFLCLQLACVVNGLKPCSSCLYALMSVDPKPGSDVHGPDPASCCTLDEALRAHQASRSRLRTCRAPSIAAAAASPCCVHKATVLAV